MSHMNGLKLHLHIKRQLINNWHSSPIEKISNWTQRTVHFKASFSIWQNKQIISWSLDTITHWSLSYWLYLKQKILKFTWTLALTTSIGLVTVEAVAAARGPAMACRTRWGQSLGASLESCSAENDTYRCLIKHMERTRESTLHKEKETY